MKANTTGTLGGPLPGPGRRLACARCGTAFSCDLSGNCWCAAEEVLLPMPASADGECLCRDCLRAAASDPR